LFANKNQQGSLSMCHGYLLLDISGMHRYPSISPMHNSAQDFSSLACFRRFLQQTDLSKFTIGSN